MFGARVKTIQPNVFPERLRLVRGAYFTTELSQLARSTMQFIPSSGLKGGRATKDRLDSRKSRAVRSIAVFWDLPSPIPKRRP
jgi:hypothetical protein